MAVGACMDVGACIAAGCMVGGMHDRGGHVSQEGACMAGGHAWQGACVAGGHAWQILRLQHTVKERAVRILLECILVFLICFFQPIWLCNQIRIIRQIRDTAH